MSALAGVAGLGKPVLDILLPILAKSAAPMLVDAIKAQSPLAGGVVEAIAEKLGVPPKPEAIAERFDANPTATAEIIRAVEADSPEKWAAIAKADEVRDRIFAREHDEAWWAWAWRPAWMWFLIAVWGWTAVSVFLARPHIDFATLLALTGIFQVLYMGGHTLKDVAAKWTGRDPAA